MFAKVIEKHGVEKLICTIGAGGGGGGGGGAGGEAEDGAEEEEKEEEKSSEEEVDMSANFGDEDY